MPVKKARKPVRKIRVEIPDSSDDEEVVDASNLEDKVRGGFKLEYYRAPVISWVKSSEREPV